MSTATRTPLIWIDLEMSGLNPDENRILEIASIVTDHELNVLAEGPDLVVHQPDEVLDAMDAWNTEHHGASGLIDRVRQSTVDVAEAEAQTLAFLAEHVGPQKGPLAGNSVHQDRLFLVKYMPKVFDYLHYRNCDVTTIKELARRWVPAIYDSRPRKKSSHRALDDIRESIEELRYYRERFFIESADALPGAHPRS